MPLAPKQQPPYYTPETTITGSIITKVATQTTIVESDTTNLTQAGIYLMPANTMDEDGNILIIDYFGNTYGTPTTAEIFLNIFGGLIQFTTTGNKSWRLNAQIVRSTSLIAYYCAIFSYESGTNVIQGSIGSLNWNQNHNMQIAIQAPTDGNVRCTAGYTQLLK